jgi:hypothetical protein
LLEKGSEEKKSINAEVSAEITKATFPSLSLLH